MSTSTEMPPPLPPGGISGNLSYPPNYNFNGRSGSNIPDNETLPLDMRFNEGHVVSIIFYSVLMCISAFGNITVLVLILQRRKKSPSRINMMLMHLAVADLLVTFLMMPVEIIWAFTVSWKAGDLMCRVMAFFRTFGLYLSSFILVCISCDRYYAVLRPMNFSGIDQRGKWMVACAWIASILCSVPQSVVFHVKRHPKWEWYEQCVTYGSFPSYAHEVTYSMFGMVAMYGIPLTVIIFTYTSILAEIFRRSRDSETDNIRRSSLGFLGRAKVRTLKMTIIIVMVFVVCWTPYYIMSTWYWIDPESAMKVDMRLQKCLFWFACTNSCMNPLVYGAFNIRARRGGGRGNGQNSELGTTSRQSSRTHLRPPERGVPPPPPQPQPPSTANQVDVVCVVSWKKTPEQTNVILDEVTAGKRGGGSINQHPPICVSCGKAFHIRFKLDN